MIPPLARLMSLLLIFFCHFANAQNWYSDHSFIHYYTPEGEIFLSPDYSSVDIYLKNGKKGFSLKKLKKSKNFLRWERKENVLSLDLNYSFNANDGIIDLETISAEYGIPKSKIKEVVPTVWVNGKIRARLRKEFIISLNSSIRPDFLESVLTRLEGEMKASRPDGSLVIRMNKIKNGFDLMHELAGLGFIEYAQPDMEVKIEHMDPLFGKQFQLQNM